LPPKNKKVRLGDLEQRRVEKQHRLSVWEAVYDYLETTFMAKDGRGPKILRSPGCVEDEVRQETLDLVLQEIAEQKIGPIKSWLEKIPDVLIEVPDEESEEAPINEETAAP